MRRRSLPYRIVCDWGCSRTYEAVLHDSGSGSARLLLLGFRTREDAEKALAQIAVEIPSARIEEDAELAAAARRRSIVCITLTSGRTLESGSMPHRRAQQIAAQLTRPDDTGPAIVLPDGREVYITPGRVDCVELLPTETPG